MTVFCVNIVRRFVENLLFFRLENTKAATHLRSGLYFCQPNHTNETPQCTRTGKISAES